MLVVCEKYLKYSYKTSDEALPKVSHQIINRKMYIYAKNEYATPYLIELSRIIGYFEFFC